MVVELEFKAWFVVVDVDDEVGSDVERLVFAWEEFEVKLELDVDDISALF